MSRLIGPDLRGGPLDGGAISNLQRACPHARLVSLDDGDIVATAPLWRTALEHTLTLRNPSKE